jgi:hypothetical protein
MNPGLIPPAEVAAAAKRGLELREKFHRGGTSVGVHRAQQLAARRILSRHYRDQRLFRPSRGRQGVEEPRMGRRNRPLRGLYCVAAMGRRARTPLGGRFDGASEQNSGGIAAAEPPRERTSPFSSRGLSSGLQARCRSLR